MLQYVNGCKEANNRPLHTNNIIVYRGRENKYNYGLQRAK